MNEDPHMNRSTTMELDDLRAAWATLDARLRQQLALNESLLHASRGDRLRRMLQPLAWGQVVQIVFGAALIVAGAGIWAAHRDSTHLFVTGLSVHLAGLAMVVLGVWVQLLLARIDFGAPVLEIQRRLLQVREVYVRGGVAVGLAWWILWIPVALVALAYNGIDLYPHAATWVWAGIGVGVLGIAATAGFHRWSRAPGRERLARAIDRQLAGRSLTRVRDELEAIARFERD